ncbi:MAG TPA: SDR family NAD(P)-dependent oxidoreductase [Kofleriaceae bacterium]|jgi:NAD(P)-dependent dehydrogenase (short-subunit alcohol dehydrogenase family)
MRVVVTGGTGGLGAAVVETFLARGADVHLPIVEAELPGHLAWRGHAKVHAARVSLDDEAQVAGFYAALPDLWASIHLVGGFAMAPIAETSLAQFEQQWRINAVTCFLGCREAVKAIRKSGKGGRIVNVAARPVVSAAKQMTAYAAGKAAVASITQTLGAELVEERILVNAVLPSIIDTPANRTSMPKADHARWPKPAQIAETIAFLASEGNTLTSGTLVPVYGAA